MCDVNLEYVAENFTGVILFDGAGSFEVRRANKFFYFANLCLNVDYEPTEFKTIYANAENEEAFDLNMLEKDYKVVEAEEAIHKLNLNEEEVKELISRLISSY